MRHSEPFGNYSDCVRSGLAVSGGPSCRGARTSNGTTNVNSINASNVSLVFNLLKRSQRRLRRILYLRFHLFEMVYFAFSSESALSYIVALSAIRKGDISLLLRWKISSHSSSWWRWSRPRLSLVASCLNLHFFPRRPAGCRKRGSQRFTVRGAAAARRVN